MFQDLGKALRPHAFALSAEAMDICLAGLTKSSMSQYRHHIEMFRQFCCDRGISDHLGVTVATGVEFLTSLYRAGKSFSTIGSARSALSHFVQLKDCQEDLDFGKHPLTTRFMRGVFKLRPQHLGTTAHGMLVWF